MRPAAASLKQRVRAAHGSLDAAAVGRLGLHFDGPPCRALPAYPPLSQSLGRMTRTQRFRAPTLDPQVSEGLEVAIGCQDPEPVLAGSASIATGTGRDRRPRTEIHRA